MTPLPFNLDQARRETPGCQHVVHFNNAGSSLMPQPVIEAVMSHLQLESIMGGYEAEAEANAKIENTYSAIARLINAQRDEIALVESASYAWNAAFHAISFQPGDRILTSVAEYASNYIAFLQKVKTLGIRIEVIPNDEYGQTSVEALSRMIDKHVRLIAITHIPTNGGLVNPAAQIGKIARQAGILYLLDACQSVGQYPIDVEAIGCDMLSATGRKYLRAPRGTGFLYIRKALLDQLEPHFLDLHSASWSSQNTYTIRADARRFEFFESSVAGKIGLGVAVDYALHWGTPAIWDRISELASRLRNQLTEIPGVRVQDIGKEKCGIVTFTAHGKSPEAIKAYLQQYHINVSISSRGSTRLDMEARQLDQLVRASVHYYNSEAEINTICQTLEKIL